MGDTFQFRCPRCGQTLTGIREVIGRATRCPGCGASLTNPAPPQTSPKPEAPKPRAPQQEDFYTQWLGIAPGQRPPSHEELLGLRPDEADAAVIERATKERMRIVKQYQIGAYQKQAVEMLLELSIARTMMLARAREAAARPAAQLEAVEEVEVRPAAPTARPRVPAAAAGPPARTAVAAGSPEAEAFGEICDYLVMQGGAGAALTERLAAYAARMGIEGGLAREIVDRAVGRRARRRRRDLVLAGAGVGLMALVTMGFAHWMREQSARPALDRAQRLAEREQYREAAEALSELPALTLAGWQGARARQRYERLADGKDLLAEAVAFEAKNPQSHQEVASRYRRVVERAPDSEYSRKALGQIRVALAAAQQAYEMATAAPAPKAPPPAVPQQQELPQPTEPKVAVPRGRTVETQRVKVATPAGEEWRDIMYYTNTIGMKFALIPAGEFMMGSPIGLCISNGNMLFSQFQLSRLEERAQ